MTDSNLVLKPVKSDHLYFGRWQYCIRFRLPEISVLRYWPTSDEIDELLDARMVWRTKMNRSVGKHLLGDRRLITDEDHVNLKSLREFLDALRDNNKLVVTTNNAWFYSNDLGALSKIHTLAYLQFKACYEIIIDRPRNTIRLKNSSYQYRSYFRCTVLTQEQKQSLAHFFRNQQDLRMSPGLTQYFDAKWSRTQDYFFIDHTDDKWMTMISLIRPGLIRTTKEIITK